MAGNGISDFQRKIIGERIMLMLPFNVVLVGRVRGAIDPAAVRAALERLRSRHPLLAVRVKIGEDGSGMFLSEDVPPIPVDVEPRVNEDRWLVRVAEEFRTSFPIESGPLLRCTLIHSENFSEIILCGHHVICDGMSLGYLLRDLLSCLAEPKKEIAGPLIPPPIDRSTVATPPKTNAVQRFVMGLINKKWAAKDIQFSTADIQRMHAKFWEQNSGMQLLAWDMTADDTVRLVERSREEKVTVNAALWAAFLAAQYEIQGDKARYRQRSALAVNTRNELRTSAGESFGFYASSLTVNLPYNPRDSFWDTARNVHSKITQERASANLFKMLSSEELHPRLLDSLYFQKYGFLEGAIQNKFLRKMGWHQVTYGYALTNVGRFDIPTNYGAFELDAVYGPLFYSDVEEKMVGVITVGGRLSFFHASRRAIVDDATRLQETAMKYLEKAIGKGS